MAEIRFGNNATHKKPAAPGGQQWAFYSIPANPEQSGDVIVPANHLAEQASMAVENPDL
jgi:hypothetical protein